MKFNDETSMEPHLMEEIQTLLGVITANFRSQIDNTAPVARLGGICTAIHAFTGEVWTLNLDTQLWYVLVSEDETECITPAEL